jgi:hypothetical protein
LELLSMTLEAALNDWEDVFFGDVLFLRGEPGAQ